MIEWTDKAQAIAAVFGLVVSIGSTWFVVLSLRQASAALRSQNVSNDTATVLSIWAKLDEHWERFRNAKDDSKNFEFGQLTSYYEMACRLFRDEIFKTKAALTLYEHLQEILPAMLENAEFKSLFESLSSCDETFENIRWLCNQKTRLKT